MPKTKTDPKQKAIDKGWALFNSAMENLDELSCHLDELEDEHDVDVDRTREAVGDAHERLESVYSYGAPILPTHSNDKG